MRGAVLCCREDVRFERLICASQQTLSLMTEMGQSLPIS